MKAQVAWESLSTHLSVDDLASKHGVKDWEVIKWRSQAREEYCRFALKEVKDYSPELEKKAQDINISLVTTKRVRNLAKKKGVGLSDLTMLRIQRDLDYLAWCQAGLVDFFNRTV